MKFEQNDVVEFSLLDKQFISKYNLEQTEENVLKIISSYLKAQYKYIDIIPPRMTSNYDVKYESFNKFNISDKVGNHVEKKVDAELEIEKFYRVMTNVIKRMNTYERIYYTELLINGKSERYTSDLIGVSRNGLKPIKNSCILKIALAFNKEVEL